jgi:alpha-methylacyl-CoA racemase
MGPLDGIRILEMAGIGPAPFAGMMLSGLGAEVLLLDRPLAADLGIAMAPEFDLLRRGRRSVAIDLKSKAGRDTALKLVASADALIEGFRPGVMERLGLGPDVCAARNPRLVYGRMTGWGQNGPLANAAGHDINYIALTGALHAIGPKGARPVPPLNLVGDFGGGGMLLALGLVSALLEAKTSGKGQVVDTAMTDGAANLMTIFYGLRAAGLWDDERGTNLLDSGAPWYDTYETLDNKYVAIGAIEARFYENLLRCLGLETENLPDQNDRTGWPVLREKFESIFLTKTRDQWCEVMGGADACFAPVLSLEEAPRHAHNVARGTFTSPDGVPQPAPAPRFNRTSLNETQGPVAPGANTSEALIDWGLTAAEISALVDAGVVTQLKVNA